MLKKLLIVSSIFSGIVAEPKHSAGNDFQAQLDSVEDRLKQAESEAFKQKFAAMLKGYEKCMMPFFDHIRGKKVMTATRQHEGTTPFMIKGAKRETPSCLKNISTSNKSVTKNKELEKFIKL